MRQRTSIFLVPVLASLFAASAAGAATFSINVPATSNIYGAGHAAPPAPGGNGAGVLPTLVTLPPGNARLMTLSNVTGSIDFGPCCAPNDADGVFGAGTGPSNSLDGIAGMTIARGRFLGAVFLDDSEPADPPPAGVSIPDIGFASLAPALRESFFAGDGLTGTGTGSTQVFQVPDGATRVFFGFHDAGPPDPSLPGWYGDNSGSLDLSVTIEAGPGVPALGFAGRIALVLALGATGLAARHPRRARRPEGAPARRA